MNFRLSHRTRRSRRSVSVVLSSAYTGQAGLRLVLFLAASVTSTRASTSTALFITGNGDLVRIHSQSSTAFGKAGTVFSTLSREYFLIMSRPRIPTPPLGHALQSSAHEPVPNHSQGRLITAYRAGQATWPPNNPIDSNTLPNVRTDTPLRGDYQQAVAHVAGVDKDYQRELRSLLQTFPQGDGEVPTRPKPEQMQVLFEKVLFHDQTRSRGKGSKGGVKHYECKWPSCPFKGTLQKCMDHFFCEHVKLKFFRCDQPNW